MDLERIIFSAPTEIDLVRLNRLTENRWRNGNSLEYQNGNSPEIRIVSIDPGNQGCCGHPAQR